ncbi:MAG: hypothetical protein ACI9FN_002128 [Saprospiraceae bacterium]|jgi:hypothetical protein
MQNLLFTILLWISAIAFASGQKIQIQFPVQIDEEQIDGRLILLLATNNDSEPRFQLRDGANTCQGLGMDVENWKKGESLPYDIESFGYPLQSMAEVPDGDYYVQVLFHQYETFDRADGHTVKMPMDRGEGQQWNRAPGNTYSAVQKLSWSQSATWNLELTEMIPKIPDPEDSKYVKHIKMRSELLSEFWGRDIYLGAHVLLPEGWDAHPEVRYPLAVFHGHFPSDFGGWRTTPPDTNMKPTYSDRFGVDGYNITVQQEAYDFYKLWTGPDFPRVLAIEIQHANPFYDDSYAVNSENLGPYGDAITYELIPYIEEQFRGIGEGWARFTYGGSTGGWEALAVQVKYPTEYNGCYAACPDPIDFRAFCLTNIYKDDNAYYVDGPFRRDLVPGHRDYLGNVSSYLRDMNYRERVLGTKSRSGQQWDIWEAVYSPVGTDGYPQRIWDKITGRINKKVAEYWKENFDLAYILKRDWNKYGDDWRGKIKIYCGDMDNYYLNNAVYLAQDILESLESPTYDGEVDYGDRAEHCWNGDHSQPNSITRLRYNRMFIPRWADEVKERAPEGVDLVSWRY